jgi:hypothetical protein
MDLRDLPLRPITIDTEFVPHDDGTQTPVCVTACDGWTGKVYRRFADACGERPFYPHGPDTVLVAHNAAAELATYRALGWPLPQHVIDTYAEHMCLTNGLPATALRGVLPKDRANLLAARRCWGLAVRATEAKRGMIDLILSGGPYSAEERAAILGYCGQDVDDTDELLRVLVSHWGPRDVAPALLRGRYARALDRFNHNGYPVDVELHDTVIGAWGDIRAAMIDAVGDYGVYANGKFSFAAFESLLAEIGADAVWPTTGSGQRSTKEDTWREMGVAFPQIARLAEVQVALGQMSKVRPLAIGPDGRARLGKRELAYRRLHLPYPDDDKSAGWCAYRSKTGRNQPAAKEFLLLRNNWWRTLITPSPGRALLYADWTSQEIAIAAYLSSDPLMIRHYESGDFYTHYGRGAHLIPPDANKKTHGDYRDAVLKPVCLGVIYGMQAPTLALRTGRSVHEAEQMLRAHRDLYRRFWRWVEDRVAAAALTGEIATPLGWRMAVGDLGRAGDGPWITGETTLQNWSMQAVGADVLRVACIALVEAGIRVAFPLHDAVAVECDLAEVADVSRITARLMEGAAVAVLGAPIPVDVKVVRPGETLRGSKGEAMWRIVAQALRTRRPARRAVA